MDVACQRRRLTNTGYALYTEARRLTSKRTPTQRRHSGGAMCDDMEGLMSNSADTTCTSTSTCRRCTPTSEMRPT